MDMPAAERRQIENEMIFRRKNEKIGDGLSALDALHIADDEPQLITDDRMILQFQCKCSDENCANRIALRLSDYLDIHIDRDTFIVMPHHQINHIEKTISKRTNFHIVKKNKSTAEPGNRLNVTTIINS